MNAISVSVLIVFAAGDPPAHAPAAGKADPQVERILTAMEQSGANVNDLRCQVRYMVESRINIGDRTERLGTILYQKAEPHPRFFITFTESLDGPEGERRRDRNRIWYLFEHRWLHWVKEASKQIQLIEVVKAGQAVDFFDINKAPFPFPFGQKKDPLLEQFEVSVAPPTAGEENVDHLICMPKSAARVAEQWDRIDYYVLKDLRLPNKIVAVEQGGDKVTTTIFPDLSAKSINVGLKDKDFAQPDEWKKYGEPIIESLDGAKLMP